MNIYKSGMSQNFRLVTFVIIIAKNIILINSIYILTKVVIETQKNKILENKFAVLS